MWILNIDADICEHDAEHDIGIKNIDEGISTKI